MSYSIDHVQLAMPPGRESEAIAYFCDVIGFDQEQKPEPLADRGGCWFSSGNCKLHVGTEAAFSAQKKAHPAFLCDEIDSLAARLEAAGYPVKWSTEFEDRRRFYTEDPFGNRIEFMLDGDGFSQK